MNNKQQVLLYLKANPNASNKDLYTAFPNIDYATLKTYRNQFKQKYSELTQLRNMTIYLYLLLFNAIKHLDKHNSNILSQHDRNNLHKIELYLNITNENVDTLYKSNYTF